MSLDDIGQRLALARALLRAEPYAPQDAIRRALVTLDAVAAAVEDEPPRAARLRLDTVIDACPLHACGIRASVCLERLRRGDAAGTTPARPGSTISKRGRDMITASCSVLRCAVGRKVRAALGGKGGTRRSPSRPPEVDCRRGRRRAAPIHPVSR